MGFFQDFLKMFKKREIALLESRKEAEDVYTFLFKKDGDLTWVAGQHGLFRITHKKIKNALKPFSVASSPSENVIRVTMGVGKEPSEFKKAMLELKPGMTLNLIGPVGGFKLDSDSPAVLIAGGIGITPFRSILKGVEAEGKSGKQPIHLLYLESNRPHLYKDEWNAIAVRPDISISYLDSREALNEEIDKLTAQYRNKANYMIAGPKSMVGSIASYIQQKQIAKGRIKKDAFFGY
ncbi:FAD-dependent oxidoreductase [Paenibacillus sp. HB172176]|uniref:FAD-dependent oxidoreductase n=1 Tax=Paenibacillus sp. HB172176 TaxID=2493690 RepID=UPI00143BA754|nr:FAD-dependent oxidoreductase [Paenibacillus sp. HB172176]